MTTEDATEDVRSSSAIGSNLTEAPPKTFEGTTEDLTEDHRRKKILGSNLTEEATEDHRRHHRSKAPVQTGGEPLKGSPVPGCTAREPEHSDRVLTEIQAGCKRITAAGVDCERLAAMAREAEFLTPRHYPRWIELAEECRTVAKRCFESGPTGLTGRDLQNAAIQILGERAN